MLYNLNDDLLPALRANDKKTWNAVHILLLRYGEGKHIVTLSRDTLKEIKANKSLGAAAERAVDNLRGRLDDRAGLRAAALVQVDVVPDTMAEGWAKFGNHDMYNLRASSIDEVDDGAATALVAEGDFDLKVLVKATEARHHTDKRGLRGLFAHTTFNAINGGGGSIGAVISERVKHPAPLFTVVDSDKDGPDCAAGLTLSLAKSALDGATRCPAKLYELPARELENLLPERLVLAALTPGDQKLNAEQSARMNDATRRELLFPKNKGERYHQLKDLLKLNILKRCAEHVTTLTPEQLARLIFTDDDGTWHNLTTLLAWWGCSNDKVRL